MEITDVRGDEPYENPADDDLDPGYLPYGKDSQEKYCTDRENDPKYKPKQKFTFWEKVRIFWSKFKPWINQGVGIITKYAPMPVWAKLALDTINNKFIKSKGLTTMEGNSILKGRVWAVVLLIVAIVAVIVNVLGFIGTEIMIGILGFAGFGSIAGLRAYVDSKGIKTYVAAIIGGVTIVLVLSKVIPTDAGMKILGVVGSLTGIFLTEGVQKAQT